MGTVNANFLPAVVGLTLGNQNQLWTAYLQDTFAGTIVSNSLNPSLTGLLRLSSTDVIGWRNTTNLFDVTLGKTGAAVGTTPADTLFFSGAGIEGPFISNQPNPASAGQIRLSDGDVLNFRNHLDNGDVAALTHNSDDSITLGGAAGAAITGSLNVGGNLNVTGNFVPKTIKGGGPGGLLALGTGNAVVVNTSSGGVAISTGTGNGTGNSGQIGLTTGDAGATGNSGNILLDTGAAPGGTVGTLQTNTTVSKYNNIATVGLGVPSEVALVDALAQTAAITTTTLYAVPATGAGQYRLSWNAKVTTPATTGAATSTLGALTVVYTDPDGVAQTITCGAQTSAGAIATTSATNTTAAVLLGLSMLLNCKASTNITYAIAYASNTANQMAYNLHIRLEAL